MHYDLKRIYEWPTVPKLIVVGVVCLVVFYLGYLVDISSLTTRLAASVQKEQDLKAQVLGLANQQAKMANELSIFPELERTITQQQKQLIAPGELPELLNEIIEIGKLNDVDILNMSPGPVDLKGAYPRVEIKVSIAGSYEQISEFISQLANLQKVIEVSDMTIAKGIEEKKAADTAIPVGVLTADLSLIVYEAKKS